MKHIITIIAALLALTACAFDIDYNLELADKTDAEADAGYGEFDARIRDAAIECGCQWGTHRCAPEGQEVCNVIEAGCWAWGDPVPCSDGERCQGDAGVRPDVGLCREIACDDQCELGESRCAGPASVRVCIEAQCTYWSPYESCDDGEVCRNGSCVNQEEQ